jgi:hypothetical protein
MLHLPFLHTRDHSMSIGVANGKSSLHWLYFDPDTCRGLLSYMLVCSMTIGASNTTGYQRFLGTCIGAVLAIVGWLLARGNPFALATFGWTVSLGCFHLVVAQGKGPMGRFILLTYNLSALYAYSLSVKDGEDDEDEASHSKLSSCWC